jgi:hypothetical protein
MNSETFGNLKNFVGFDEAEVKRTSTEDLLSLRTVILTYLKKNSARKRSISFKEVYKRIMDELERRKSASNSLRDTKKILIPSFNEENFHQEQIESSIEKLNNIHHPLYNKQESLLFNPKYFYHPSSIKKDTKMINIHPIKPGKMKEVASCPVVSLEFLGKKRQMPLQNSDYHKRETSFDSMYEATRKFFERNRSEIIQERACVSRSNSQVRIKQQAAQITYISQLAKHKFNEKKSLQKISKTVPSESKETYTYTSSPQNRKDLESWMSSTQSILPSIEIEDNFFTENTSKLDNMMHSHINNECKAALFDVPDEIFFELE